LQDVGDTFVDTPTLLADSDVATVHTPLTQTHHLIDAAALRAMKPTAYLIDTARGGVVDETALIAALRTGQIRGAALDVFEGEPDVNPALLDVGGLVLTSHTASAGEATSHGHPLPGQRGRRHRESVRDGRVELSAGWPT
jgi:phosphoglycerate dehydrogenase-like enzyme